MSAQLLHFLAPGNSSHLPFVALALFSVCNIDRAHLTQTPNTLAEISSSCLIRSEEGDAFDKILAVPPRTPGGGMAHTLVAFCGSSCEDLSTLPARGHQEKMEPTPTINPGA